MKMKRDPRKKVPAVRASARRSPVGRAEPRRQIAIQAALEGFRRTSGILHKLTRAASGGEFGLADAFLLHFIGSDGPRTPSDIASFTGLTSGSVTSLIDRLERAGHLSRERSTKDRRVVLVSLTPKARHSLAAMMAKAHADIEEMFDAWTTQEIAAFAGLLSRFGQAVASRGTKR